MATELNSAQRPLRKDTPDYGTPAIAPVILEEVKFGHATVVRTQPISGMATTIAGLAGNDCFGGHGDCWVNWPSIGAVSPSAARAFTSAIIAVADRVEALAREMDIEVK